MEFYCCSLIGLFLIRHLIISYSQKMIRKKIFTPHALHNCDTIDQSETFYLQFKATNTQLLIDSKRMMMMENND